MADANEQAVNDELQKEFARQILEKRKQEEQKQRELFLAYASWANSISGSRVIAHLREEVSALSYAPGRDAMETAFREGRRSIVLDILANVDNGQKLAENADLERSDLQTAAEQGDIFDA